MYFSGLLRIYQQEVLEVSLVFKNHSRYCTHTVAYNVHSLYRSVGWGEGVGGYLGQYFLGCAAGLSEPLLHYNLFCGQL